MTLTLQGSLDRGAVSRAVDSVIELIGQPAVAAAWARESSCAGMSVGGLTWHLVGQPVNVVRLVRAGDQPGVETIPLLEHYVRAAWVTEDLDGDSNRGIRTDADEQAAQGPEAAVAAAMAAREELDFVLATAGPTTAIPWQGWALATDDFLVTRLMEIVVHSDDLASSVGLPTPDFGLAVLDPVCRLLTAVAVRRHGQDAIIRALARPQRAPATVSAF